MTTAKTIELVKAAGERMVRRLGAVVPFAKQPRRVACRLKHSGNRRHARVEALPPLGDARHSVARGVAAREKLSPRRSAHRLHIESLEPSPRRRQAVEARGRQVGIAVTTQVAPAHVVRNDHQHVGLRLNGKKRCRETDHRQQCEQQA